ncbi:MAG TPA: hypothetical protein DEQ49_13520 [Arthrobacter bacterium]|nr:hypothetical protein [Arthrobacter sp.]
MAGVGLCSPFNDEPGQFLAVEPDLDPDACLRCLIQLSGHAVIKGTVQVWQGCLHEDPCHRQAAGQRRPGLRRAHREPLKQ